MTKAKAKPTGPCISVPVSLMEAAQTAQGDLIEAQQAFEEAAEDRRNAKDTLQNRQEVYNVASANVVNFGTAGFKPGTPMAAAAKAEGKDTDNVPF